MTLRQRRRCASASLPGEVPASEKPGASVPVVVLLPGVGGDQKVRAPDLGILAAGLGDLHRLAERVVREQAHELPHVDVGHPLVVADHDHVLVVGVGARLAEVGRAGDD